LNRNLFIQIQKEKKQSLSNILEADEQQFCKDKRGNENIPAQTIIRYYPIKMKGEKDVEIYS
jgi:hypothetical protein